MEGWFARATLDGTGLEIISEIMTKIVHFALKLAPFAVPAMIDSVIVKIGFDILAALAVFVVGCAAMMLLHLFGTMSIWLKLWTAYGPLRFFRQIRTVLLTAFSTSSSAATLPAAFATAQGTLGLRPSVVGFVLPLIAGLLVAFGIPPEGIGIILGVDRILDMTRTMVNVGSDMVTCAVVDARVRVAEERAANRTAAA